MIRSFFKQTENIEVYQMKTPHLGIDLKAACLVYQDKHVSLQA